MIKKLVLTTTLVAFVGPTFAGSSPALIKAIDATLTSGKAANVKEVRKLRDTGEALHKSGGHSSSVDVLNEAMKLAGISK